MGRVKSRVLSKADALNCRKRSSELEQCTDGCENGVSSQNPLCLTFSLLMETGSMADYTDLEIESSTLWMLTELTDTRLVISQSLSHRECRQVSQDGKCRHDGSALRVHGKTGMTKSFSGRDLLKEVRFLKMYFPQYL